MTSLDGIPRVGVWENGKRLTWLKESELDMAEQSAEESKEGLGVVQEYSHSQSQSQDFQQSQDYSYNRESDQINQQLEL